MNVTVVSSGSGWILDSIARRLCAADPEHFHHHPFPTVFRPIPGQGYNVVIPDGTEAIYYMDIQCCWPTCIRDFPSLNALLHVGFMTHLDRDSTESFWRHWAGLDGVVHMCQRYYDVFAEQGWYPRERMAILRPGEPCADVPLTPLRVGICQRGEHVGKGRDFLPAV
mgnify:FL=1